MMNASRAALFDLHCDDHAAPSFTLLQGSHSALCFASPAARRGFAERLAVSSAGETEFSIAHWRCRRHLPAAQFGLLSRRPYLLADQSVLDNLRLAGSNDGALSQALSDTGLLQGVALQDPASSLEWPQQVELNFIQLWLRAPQALLLDHLFSGEQGDALLHLPALYRRRYPFRAVCYLEQAGRLPDSLGASSVEYLA